MKGFTKIKLQSVYHKVRSRFPVSPVRYGYRQRIAEPEEIANVVTFPASEASSYMTGATLDVSGGMMMR
jgi:NAD(P)-dependent dehydrogenase (short-subunit alcohol dehydrogenase family)